jgi:uncharacterized protein YndB with AHSA1/START domain
MATSLVDAASVQGAGRGPKVEIVRVIKASKQRVFDAWTRPEMVRQWFRAGETHVSDASLDVRKDGAWRMDTVKGCQPESGPPVQNTGVTGRYLAVDPYDRLVFTWKRSADPEEESLVTITLRDVEGGTELTLVHERFLTEASRDQHAMGWEAVIGNLAKFFEA